MRNLIATYVETFTYAANRNGKQAALHYIGVLRNGSTGNTYTFTLVEDVRNGTVYYYIYSELITESDKTVVHDCNGGNCWC